MRTIFVVLTSIFTIAIPFCALSANVIPGVPELSPVHIMDKEISARKVNFSADGKYFVTWGGFDIGYGGGRGRLFAAEDYSQKFITDSAINKAGFIDNNTWYYAVDADFLVRTIDHPVEIYHHDFDQDTLTQYIDGSPVPNPGKCRGWSTDPDYYATDKLIVYFPCFLQEWKMPEKKVYPITAFSPYIHHASSGSHGTVLTYESAPWLHNYYSGLLFYIPLKGKINAFGTFDVVGAQITPDERFVIAISDKGNCKVWRYPEMKEHGNCGFGLSRFIPFKKVDSYLALDREGKTFAVGIDDRIRVYRFDPFGLEADVTLPKCDDIFSIALSNDGKLAVTCNADVYPDESPKRTGFLFVWDVTTGKLIGAFDNGEDWRAYGVGFEPHGIDFQPNGNKLIAVGGGPVKIFSLPTP